ncbi:hypothetical protein CHKEEEPN_0958 [Methylorubrum podarium]|nr:hypothetical protein CHKEEEPN_0958 [Methylorubrum podarium]
MIQILSGSLRVFPSNSFGITLRSRSSNSFVSRKNCVTPIRRSLKSSWASPGCARR